MSNTTIDSLFLPSNSAPKVRTPLQTGQEQPDAFRAHLDRATETTEAKPAAQNRAPEEAAPAEEELPVNTLETSAGEQEEASTDESEQPTVPPETPEQTETPAATDQDTLLLSAAAIAHQGEAPSGDLPAVTQQASLATADQPSENPTPANPNTANLPPENPTPTGATQAPTTITTAAAIAPTTAPTTDGVLQTTEAQPPQLSADAPHGTRELTSESQAVPAELVAPVEAASATKRATNAAENQPAASAPANPESSAPRPLAAPAELPEAEAATVAPEVATTDQQPAPSTSGAAVAELTANEELAIRPETTEPVPRAPAPTVTAGQQTTSDPLASQGEPPSDLPEAAASAGVDRARFVRRVGGAIRSAQSRDGTIQLRLSPPELGTLRIQIMVKEGVVTAQLETESAAARTVLLDNLPALRERLAEQEIRIEKFDVNVGRENQQQTDHSEAEQRRKHRSRVQAQKLSAKNATTDTSTLPTTSLDPQSELDVRI